MWTVHLEAGPRIMTFAKSDNRKFAPFEQIRLFMDTETSQDFEICFTYSLFDLVFYFEHIEFDTIRCLQIIDGDTSIIANQHLTHQHV